jgi:hypothetical protein
MNILMLEKTTIHRPPVCEDVFGLNGSLEIFAHSCYKNDDPRQRILMAFRYGKQFGHRFDCYAEKV